MKILMTAFDPFGGSTLNPAEQALSLVCPPDGVELRKLTVPTVFGRSTEMAVEAIDEFCPDCVVCVGQAAGRRGITPERAAINVRDARIADNAGNKPVDEPIEKGGDAAYFSTLPIKLMVRKISEKGIPASVSNTAGTFVCNDLMYGVLHAVKGKKIRAGFVHVPCIPEQLASFPEGTPSLELSDIVTGLETVLEACLCDFLSR